MSRRGFLKQVSVAAAFFAPGGKLAVRAVEAGPAGAFLGAASITGAGAAGGEVTAAAMTLPMLFLRQLERGEERRATWYALWRKHRIAVRRHQVNPKPAKLVWLEFRLKEIRQAEAFARANVNSTRGARLSAPWRSKQARRAEARTLAAFRRAGLRHPWEEYMTRWKRG